MENFTNDIAVLLDRAKKEVADFDNSNDKTIIKFCEYPTIAGFPYCVVVIKHSENKIISKLRQWDTAYDMKRWSYGIYNLDRIRVITHTYKLLSSENGALHEALNRLENHLLPKTIGDSTAIALDGSDFELIIQTKPVYINYTWRVATNKIDLFIPLIELLKGYHKQKIKNYA